MPGDVKVQDGEIETAVGAVPIVPLIFVGGGAYLLWFAVKYWRGEGPAVWPSYPIKSVLQGKGIPGPQPAPATADVVASYEAETIAQAKATTTPVPIAQTFSKQPPPPGPPGPPPPPNASETMIIRAILSAIGAPQTQANINSMSAWIQHETPWPPVAKFNPMNTTLPMPGSTCFNSVCVRNYVSWAQGIEATARTLLGGYSCIVSQFRAGLGVCGTRCSADFSKWSGGGYSSVC